MRKTASGIMLSLLVISISALAFNIQPLKAEGTIYIRADGSIDPPTAPIQRDGDVYTFTDNIYDSIIVERSNIIIDGANYTLQGPGDPGIGLVSRYNVTVRHMNIRAFSVVGIDLSHSSSCSIIGNSITNSYCGIQIFGSSNNRIVGNSFTNNGLLTTIGSLGNVITDNIVNGKPLVYLETITSHNVSDAGQVILINCDDVRVANLNLSAVTVGLQMVGTNNSKIINNSIMSNVFSGISLDRGSNNSIIGNNIRGNTEGIVIRQSSNNSISWNNVTETNGGMSLFESSNNRINGNNITNNEGGIVLWESSNNRFWHNNLVGNTLQVYIATSGYANVWDADYPSGGNYWSDYHERYPEAEELEGSGIWDTPYVIDENNQDNYPLLNPWTSAPPAKFRIGDWVQTTANLNVREGPGLNHAITGIMPTGSLGQVVDGSVEADGYVWWNIDYIVGIEGWSAEDWLEIANELSDCGMPVLVSPLSITRTVDTLTAEFIVQNCGDASITFDRLLVGGRFNGGTLSSGNYPDFPYVSVTLAPDESYEYNETMELSEVGNYQFFVAYYIETPSEQERRLLDPNNWNTCIDLAEGLTDEDRSRSLEKWPAIVISSPLLITPPSGPYYPGDLLVAQFSIKNIGSVPVTLDTLTVGGRDPDGLTIDLDWKSNLTLYPAGEPDDEYTYIGTRRVPGKIGNYHFFCAYQAADGSWNPCIDLDEGLTDTDRVKDIYVESEYPLGGIVIPEADFPEGNGNVIPIYVPPVIDGSNVIREGNGWQTIKTLAKADWSFDWQILKAGFAASGSAYWDPTLGQYVMAPAGNILDLIGSYFLAFSGAQSVVQICITIQRNSQWEYRAILQVSDPEAKSLFRTYAAQGMYSFVPGELPVNVEAALSNGIADYFKLPAAKFSEVYLETLYINKAHMNEEYNCYLSLSKGNRIELTPKIYQGDVLAFNLWKQNLIFFFTTCHEVLRLEGQAFVDFEKCRAFDAESKLIQEALAPISLVPESAILLNGGSPCEFRIWDSQGRVTGLVNGEMREEIPSSVYLSEAKTIIVYDPTGDLHYEVLGTDTGTFELNITLVKDWNVTAFTASSIPIANQATHQYTIDWDALSQGEEGVTVYVDFDGDGVFEYSFLSDSELSGDEFWNLSFAEPEKNPIVDFAVYDGKLYAAADNALYIYNGSSWNSIDSPTFVLLIEPFQDKLVVGGEGGLYSYDGANFTLVFTVSNYIKPLGVYDNTLYAGSVLDNPPTLYYCAGSPENPDGWHVDTGFSTILNFSGPFGSIDSFTVYNNIMYVTSGGTVFSYNGTDWSIVTTYVDVSAFLDMKVYNGTLYLATRDQAWRKPIYQGYSGFSGRIMEFDGINWTTILDHDYWIYSLETYDGKLYAGTANKIFTYNGTDWGTSFHSEEGAYYAISMITFDGKIFVGMGNGYIFVDPAPPKANTETTTITATATIPEFLSALTLSLFMVLTALAVVFCKRKIPAKSRR